MRKKLMIISVASFLALGGVAAAGVGLASSSLGPIKAATEHSQHAGGLTEVGFEWTDPTKDGFKPYWRCAECCASDPASSRYSFADKTAAVSADELRLSALEAATAEDIASGDEIANVNVGKFKYVDQGANGVAGKEGTSTPVYVKDSGRTAIYFSASGKTGDATNPTGNDGCAEFRFAAPDSAKSVRSATFSYRYQNWGTGVWAGSSSDSEPAGWGALCQFQDGGYLGLDVSSKLVNDGAWHTLTLNYADSSATGEYSTNLTSLILKFADLRGYIMISDLSYDVVKTVTLKNASSDGADSTETVSIGSLPEAPTMAGKRFLGWYDESGNKVEAVTTSTGTLIAKWGQIGEQSSSYTEYNALTLDTASTTVSPSVGVGRIGEGTGIFANLQVTDVASYDITLPAFDFNAATRVDFFFEYNYGDQSRGTFKTGDNSFAYSSINVRRVNAYVVSDGKNASLYIGSTFMKTYDEDVSSGKKGLTFTFVRDTSQDLFAELRIGDFKQYVFDYMSAFASAAYAFPDTITDDNKAAAIAAYKTCAPIYSLMTAYEKNSYGSQIASAKAALAGETTEVLTVPTSGDGWNTAHSLGIYSDANFGVNYSESYNASWISIDLQNGGYKETKTFYVDFPKINYSAYSSVTFKICSGSCTTSTTSIKADGKDLISKADCPNQEWATAVTISTANGKTTMSAVDNSIELSEDVANGTKALRFERTRVVTDASTQLGYDSFCFSSLIATI